MKSRLLFLFFIIVTGIRDVAAQPIVFNRVDTIPVEVNSVLLNNAWAGGINFPLFSEIDLNGDGIHDLFIYDRVNNRLSTFINDGTSGTNAWHYAPEYRSHFPPINKWARLYDYNCDGKADLFTLSSCQCGIAVYRNDYDVTNGLHFTLVTDILTETWAINLNVYADAISLPTFGDVDSDGDMDIIGYNSPSDGRFSYHKNNSVEHGHGCDSLEFNLETFNWGTFQLLIGGANQVGCYGCRPAPSGDTSLVEDLQRNVQSAAAKRDDTITSVMMIDIDGDGDKDLLIGDQNAMNALLVVNGKTATSPDSIVSEDIIFPSNDVPVNIYYFTVQAYIDLDNDGVKDLVSSSTERENLHGNWFYKNLGTTANPVFQFQTTSFLTNQMIDDGEGACPVLFDYDGDGLQDLITGNYGISITTGGYKRGLHLYKNTGTSSSPAFKLVDNDFAGINALSSLLGPIYPAFGDLTGDGIQEMIIGSDNGRLQYFSNSSVPANFSLTIPNYSHIDDGSAVTPQLIDLNRDGLLDLVIGNKNGLIKYHQNTGTSTSPVFDSIPTKDTLGGIVVQTIATPDGYAVPYFFDEDGHYRLLVSCMKGDVYLYDNIDGNILGNYQLIDSVIKGEEGERLSFNLSVSGGDINSDGLTDMLLGIYSGGVQVYMQDNSIGIAEHSPHLSPGMIISPNPSNELCNIQFFNLAVSEKKQLRVVNYLGQTVFTKNIFSDKFSFNTKDFPAGLYFIQLVANDDLITRKLIVSH